MSKICMAVLFDIDSLEDEIKKELIQTAEKYHLACFFKIEYTEQFLRSADLYAVVSISDSQNFDNCEMFLLPDGCIHNNQKNGLLYYK